jgi:hypothetical protein
MDGIYYTVRAGEALVLHKDAEKNERWDRMKQENPILRKLTNLRRAYDESENPFVSSMRLWRPRDLISCNSIYFFR